MTDHDALLTAILANRADDTPRLVFADWCEENGQPERGEFIRVQIQRAIDGHRLPRAREQELWNNSRLNGAPHPWFGQMGFRHTANWWTTCNKPEMTVPLGRNRERKCVFSIARGFVSSLTCSWSDWRTHAAAILARQPIERVVFNSAPDREDLEDLVMAKPGIAGCVDAPDRFQWTEEELLECLWPTIGFDMSRRFEALVPFIA